MKTITLILLVVVMMSTLLFWGPNSSQAQVYDFEKMAKNVVNMLSVAGFFVAKNLDVINTHNAKLGQPIPKDQPYSYKGIDPVTFASTITKDFTIRTGIVVRFVSEGKGKYGPRNPANLPDDWESMQIIKFKDAHLPPGEGSGEFLKMGVTKKVVYRYFFPLYVNELCLKCHGDPSTSPSGDGKDVAGHSMEGYTLGDLRGGISLTFPVQ
ncbi:MAG: DUF3365 domain-containing protein [Candidatus Brocadiales bacterium]|nr:DUF3365 domain-containing protein [Candidatus Brocadiales bacterium]